MSADLASSCQPPVHAHGVLATDKPERSFSVISTVRERARAQTTRLPGTQVEHIGSMPPRGWEVKPRRTAMLPRTHPRASMQS